MTFLASICIYPNGNIRYIDALFFASGAATQSGLNTIDVNLLNTWQQLVIYFTSIGTNPIVIHSFVVFLRLYWFEKRFQNVVREARKNRRSIARSFSRAKSNERDVGHEERGVDGRNITVMHTGNHPETLSQDEPGATKVETPGQSSLESSAETAVNEKPETPIPVIQFADQVKQSGGTITGTLRLPAMRDPQEHIAFLESQRDSEKGEVLRIPGPREYDAGGSPHALALGMRRPLSRNGSLYSEEPTSPTSPRTHDPFDNPDDANLQPPKKRITIAEPENPREVSHTQEAVEDMQAAAAAAFSIYKPVEHFRKRKTTRKTSTPKHDTEPDSFLSRTKSRAPTLKSLKSHLSMDKPESTYLSWEPTIGRNSAFVNLTEDQREELGGIEYRSLKSLALILVCYFWGFMALSIICLTPWIVQSAHYSGIVEADGQSPTWWGFFTAQSALNDVGFTLTPDSMLSFQRAVWPLLCMSFFIVIGNTGFPIMLRFIIWGTSLWVPRDSGMWEELRFLLDHPRRCFTLLFPSTASWWLFWILVMLNGVDLIFFIILDVSLKNPCLACLLLMLQLNTKAVTDLPLHARFLAGWFQAVSTRTAGFAVVNIAQLHSAIQVSYLIMMYISALPIAISIRRTNVYEERSLGIWGTHDGDDEPTESKQPSYIGAHVRRQLSFDLWFIFLGFFIIAIAEGSKLGNDEPAWNMFSVLFEIVSAYGTVGLSLGFPDSDASFSAQFNVIGKLVIIAMQIRGRHRGLPYELDRAILLPNEHRQAMEAELDLAHGHQAGTLHRHASKATTTERHHTPNLLTNFLHPGPPMVHRAQMRARRPSAVSHASHGSAARTGFMAHQDDGDARRSMTSLHSGFELPHTSTTPHIMHSGLNFPHTLTGERRTSVISEHTDASSITPTAA